MAGYDMADPDDPHTLRVPFVWVPQGAKLPLEWMARHPQWVRFPATFVPRAPRPDETGLGETGPQWNLRIDPAEAPSPAREPWGQEVPPAPPEAGRDASDAPTGMAPGAGTRYRNDTAANVAAWRNAQAAFADPMGAAWLRPGAYRLGGGVTGQAGSSPRDTQQVAAATDQSATNRNNPPSRTVPCLIIKE